MKYIFIEDFHLTNDSTLFLGRYVRKLKEF